MSFREKILDVVEQEGAMDGIAIRAIRNDEDLWYATVECQLGEGQDAFVNPAGFSIGRAYLKPEENVPCVILRDGERIGFIMLRRWALGGDVATWSYYIDHREQGKGYGETAARLAVKILKTALPDYTIKLAVEQDNLRGQRLYTRIGFQKTEELDGDDLVFAHW